MSCWGENRIEKGREGGEGGVPEAEALNHTLSKHGFYISQKGNLMGVVCLPLAVKPAAMWYWGFPGGPVVKPSPSSE